MKDNAVAQFFLPTTMTVDGLSVAEAARGTARIVERWKCKEFLNRDLLRPSDISSR